MVEPAPEGGQAVAPGEGGGGVNRLRLGLTRFTSLIVGALLFPAFSALVGSGLFWVALKLKGNWLRRLLRVDGLVKSGNKNAGNVVKLGLSSLFPLVTRLIFRSSSSGSVKPRGGVTDPIWIRNTIGGGIVLIVRDMIELVVGTLEEKRRESRRVVGRPVVVEDERREEERRRRLKRREERLASASASASSNGRGRVRRRETRVHTLL